MAEYDKLEPPPSTQSKVAQDDDLITSESDEESLVIIPSFNEAANGAHNSTNINAMKKTVKRYPTKKTDDGDDRTDGDDFVEDYEVFLHARKLQGEADGKPIMQIVSVFETSPLFQTSELERYFYMTKYVIGTGEYQLGLYTTGPFTPLPPVVPIYYGIFKFAGQNSQIKISNDVEGNKLYLRVKRNLREVRVSKKFTNKSYFHMEYVAHEIYLLRSSALEGYALKFDKYNLQVVLDVYTPGLGQEDFQFRLQTGSPNYNSCYFVFNS